MNEHQYDDMLQINTEREEEGHPNSLHYHRYEPTPYRALELFFKQYEVNSSDRIVDFGCGKGRLMFYISYFHQATVLGIEMNESLYNKALWNKQNYFLKHRGEEETIQFRCCLAQKYKVHRLDNRFYFFNPFSSKVFMQVINNILRSVEKFKREIKIVLYYPSEDYIFYLEKYTAFELVKEISLTEVFPTNANERFLVYRL
ncbi:methyltransferase [Halalkalibacter akibai]|uniref:Conserved domain protein n=1 Tax=Halalkalibacter akibai (strain ATCC 43226 / DSM 21942 / CIP 109018 / JCM 9157 / 1139) TaxID=1236973 RepID=W4QTU8_HALA3|nr:methyltransferase [Halalkalibacter akibai]GAE35491.1 conserved domain protein [Halalkalibacter akibai JCM 9157]